MNQIMLSVSGFIGKFFPLATAAFLLAPTPQPPKILHQSEIVYLFTTPSPTPTPTSTPTPKPTPQPTATPLPTPTPIVVSSGELDGWFTHYANFYGIDRQKFWLVGVCESKLRPNARSRDYVGIFQFGPGTWVSARMRMNMDSNVDLRYNPEESIRTAAFKISKDGFGAWPVCGKK